MSAEGSSPRARGALLQSHGGGLRIGIIPACAGSTLDVRRGKAAGGDHPRVRGEHEFGRLATGITGGSSPRARGARDLATRALALIGIIPACAGST